MMNLNCSTSSTNAQRKQGACVVPEPSSQVVLLEASDLAQMESIGQPVMANTFIALRHASTQANLCTDEQKYLNKFGEEFEVTVHTDNGATKASWGKRTAQVGVTNHWAFTTAAA